jgi:hypothetical protein
MLSDMPASPSPSVVTEDTASWQGYLAKGFGGHHASTTHLYMPLLSCPCCLFRTTMTSTLGAADVCGWNFTAQHADAAPGGFPSLQIHQYLSRPVSPTRLASVALNGSLQHAVCSIPYRRADAPRIAGED